jgi:hypothetical protein
MYFRRLGLGALLKRASFLWGLFFYGFSPEGRDKLAL